MLATFGEALHKPDALQNTMSKGLLDCMLDECTNRMRPGMRVGCQSGVGRSSPFMGGLCRIFALKIVIGSQKQKVVFRAKPVVIKWWRSDFQNPQPYRWWSQVFLCSRCTNN